MLKNLNLKPSLLLTGTLALAVASIPAWAGEISVTSPQAGSTSVTRTDDAGNQSQMPYVVVRDSTNTVKYEDATLGLGEDGAIESDLFVINVANAGDTVRVETKAGRDTAEWVSGESDSDVDDNGFMVEVVSISGNTYTLRLSSTPAVEEALSHVTFTFYQGQLADAAYD